MNTTPPGSPGTPGSAPGPGIIPAPGITPGISSGISSGRTHSLAPGLAHGPSSGQGARRAVVVAVAEAVERWPELPPSVLVTDGLSPLDSKLAMAIHGVVMRRWITLEYLLDQQLRKPMHALEPQLRAVLLTGAAQLLFMDRLPRYAVVDESVELARILVRSGAGGLVNAVLRRLGDKIKSFLPHSPWKPARDCLPCEDGVVQLCEACLPDLGQLDEHLRVVTSHPLALVRKWMGEFGEEKTQAICLHNIQTPPVILAVEDSFARFSDGGSHDNTLSAHRLPGYWLWHGPHDQMLKLLAGHPARRIQDPTASLPVLATATLQPRPNTIIDFCAGRGTKTRQLALTHPQAMILATEVDSKRRHELYEACKDLLNVKVIDPADAAAACSKGGVDLVVLDVPCSNTAVLARRPEARYRFSQSSLDRLVGLQRQIITQSSTLIQPRGYILYSTCSLEKEENQLQCQWMEHRLHLTKTLKCLTLPAGHGEGYCDGGYYALLQSRAFPT